MLLLVIHAGLGLIVFPRLASNKQLSSCISCLSDEMLDMMDALLSVILDYEPVIAFISR